MTNNTHTLKPDIFSTNTSHMLTFLFYRVPSKSTCEKTQQERISTLKTHRALSKSPLRSACSERTESLKFCLLFTFLNDCSPSPVGRTEQSPSNHGKLENLQGTFRYLIGALRPECAPPFNQYATWSLSRCFNSGASVNAPP